MKKIAVATYRQAPKGSVFKYRQVLSNEAYLEAVEKEGAYPVLISPSSIFSAEEIAAGFDGIILPGGDDVSPETYGEENRLSVDCDIEMDSFHIDLIKAAYKLKKPLLGICRGFQLINVAFGGSLYQDIATDFSTQIVHKVYEKPYEGVHDVKIVEGTFLSNLFPSTLCVNSLHHQGVKKLGDGLIVSATAGDGLIEAIEVDKIIGVQWHPEAMQSEMRSIFSLFIRSI